MAANIHRGEIDILIGGVPRVLRPDFTALMAIEADTGKTIQQLTALGVACAMGVTDMATILHRGLQASGVDATRDQVGQWIIEGGGAVEYYQPVGKFLVFALTGGRDPDEDDQDDDEVGEPTPGRDIRSGGWRRLLAGVWGGPKRGFGNPPRTN